MTDQNTTTFELGRLHGRIEERLRSEIDALAGITAEVSAELRARITTLEASFVDLRARVDDATPRAGDEEPIDSLAITPDEPVEPENDEEHWLMRADTWQAVYKATRGMSSKNGSKRTTKERKRWASRIVNSALNAGLYTCDDVMGRSVPELARVPGLSVQSALILKRVVESTVGPDEAT